jgi:hypothetical protein
MKKTQKYVLKSKVNVSHDKPNVAKSNEVDELNASKDINDSSYDNNNDYGKLLEMKYGTLTKPIVSEK